MFKFSTCCPPLSEDHFTEDKAKTAKVLMVGYEVLRLGSGRARSISLFTILRRY